jgi:hypothetical protein
VLQVLKERRVVLVSPESLVRLAPKEHKDLLVSRVLPAHKAQLEPQAQLVLKEQLDHKEHRVPQESQD